MAPSSPRPQVAGSAASLLQGRQYRRGVVEQRGNDVGADIAFLDSVRGLPAAAARKADLAAKLGAAVGDTVLEIGPGTGEDLQRFAAAAAPTGLAIGVDISLGLATEARRRALDSGLGNVWLVVADVRQLPIRDSAFSCAYGERVLQHVPRVEEAMHELYRVLKKGARLVVFEPDQSLRALDHPDIDTERLIRPRVAPQVANPTIGRQLYRRLTEGGFVVQSVDGVASGRPQSTGNGRVRAVVEAAVRDGELDRTRADRYLATIGEMEAAGTLFSIWIAFEVTAAKPA